MLIYDHLASWSAGNALPAEFNALQGETTNAT
jgi:hypothetical protein